MSIYNTLKIYDVDKRFHLEFDRNGYLEECIRGKSVLHVGCSDFPITEQRIKDKNLLHLKLHNSGKEIVGIDLSEEGIGILKKHGFNNVLVMDAENIELTRKFDVILAGDVLEHLNNPGKFFEKAISLLSPNAEVIIGVPSALTINNFKAWFGLWEQVHCDHTFYFSPKTLSALCARYKLVPVKLVFTVQPQGACESATFVILRKILLRVSKAMSPSFIMHFKKAEEVDRSSYVEWK